MKSLIHSPLIWGLLAGAGVGLVAALVAICINRPEMKLEWLLLAGVGAAIGLATGLASEFVSQIKRVRDNRKLRIWKDASKGIIRQLIYDDSTQRPSNNLWESS
jgi:hypothetical protein